MTAINVPHDRLVGVDFAGPASAAQQRRKIIALEASRLASRTYSVASSGFNKRLFQARSPGFTACELAQELLSLPRALVAFDFPFSLPHTLLADEAFAARAQRDGPFGSWEAFNDFVCANLKLDTPTSLAPFMGWKSKDFWLKRATDSIAAAQPPLKHQFQVLFNMTLVGNALLGMLRPTYAVLPFTPVLDGQSAVLEVYPGGTMRKLGLRDYKQKPREAIEAVLAQAKSRGVTINIARNVLTFCETYNTRPRASAADHDGADALVALVCAIFHREGLSSELLRPEDSHLRQIEGAIISV